ncbi:MAG: hypothetical protein CK427_16410 [Leptospira sp.]|nr:MAG: hypothetical protein CK427_16410 [Leptospira sp.]
MFLLFCIKKVTIDSLKKGKYFMKFSINHTETPKDIASDSQQIYNIERIPLQEVVLVIKLKKIRKAKKNTEESLTKLSGVSQSVLRQIENGKNDPSIITIWKLYKILNFPFNVFTESEDDQISYLTRSYNFRLLRFTNVKNKIKPLHRTNLNFHFYKIRISPHGIENSKLHSFGSIENLHIAEGSLELDRDIKKYILNKSDSIYINANVKRTFFKPGFNPNNIFKVISSN